MNRTQAIRKRRARVMLEIDLIDTIRKNINKKATRTEAKLTPSDVVVSLAALIVRIA